MNNWNFESLGFRSKEEMEASISRVKEQMKNPKNNLEIRAENRNNFEKMNVNDGIDFAGLSEGARLAQLDQAVANKLHWEKEVEKQRAEQEEWDKLLNAAGEAIKLGNEKAARKEFETLKAEKEAELQKEIYSKHGAKSDEETKRDNAYSEMLKGLNFD